MVPALVLLALGALLLSGAKAKAASSTQAPQLPKQDVNEALQAAQLAEVQAPDATAARDVKPAGYDAAKARAGAAKMAAHIASAKYSYSRQALKTWQKYAGLAQDGIYGPLTRAALITFGVERPPKALFKAG